jgi:hypothetical protein
LCLQDIIGRFPDLIDGFTRFLQRCETMDAVDNELRSQFGAGKISAKDMQRLKGQTVRCAASDALLVTRHAVAMLRVQDRVWWWVHYIVFADRALCGSKATASGVMC